MKKFVVIYYAPTSNMEQMKNASEVTSIGV